MIDFESHATAAAVNLNPRARAPGPVRRYRFRTAEGVERLVAWALEGRAEIDLPGRARRAVSRDGEEVPPPPAPRVAVAGSPRYFDLEEEPRRSRNEPPSASPLDR